MARKRRAAPEQPADGAAGRALLDELEDLHADERAARRRWWLRGLLLAVLVLLVTLLLAVVARDATRGDPDSASSFWIFAAVTAAAWGVAGRACAVLVGGLADRRAARLAIERRRRDLAIDTAGPAGPTEDTAGPADDTAGPGERAARLERRLLDDLDDARGTRRGLRRQAAGFGSVAAAGTAAAGGAVLAGAPWTAAQGLLLAGGLGAAVLGTTGYVAGVAGRTAAAEANLRRALRRHRERALYDVEGTALPNTEVRALPRVALRSGIWWAAPLAATLAHLVVPVPPAPPAPPGLPPGVAAVPAVAAATALSEVPLDYPAGVAVSPDGTRAYVANQGPPERPDDVVSVVDLAAQDVLGTVRVGSAPLRLALSPDGRRLYVTDGGTDAAPGRSLSVVDVASSARTAAVALPARPSDVAVAPDGRVWVTLQGDGDAPGSLVLVDPAAAAVAATVPVGREPDRLALSPDGARVYVANAADNTVSVVDAASRRVTATVPVGAGPAGLVVDAAHRTVWVTAASAPDPRHALTAVDTGTLATTEVDLGPVPDGARGTTAIALTPDGRRLLVGRYVPGPDAVPSLLVVDPATRAVVDVLPTRGVFDLAAAPDGHHAYATAGDLHRLDVP